MSPKHRTLLRQYLSRNVSVRCFGTPCFHVTLHKPTLRNITQDLNLRHYIFPSKLGFVMSHLGEARDYQIPAGTLKLFAGRSLLLKSPQPLTLDMLVERGPGGRRRERRRVKRGEFKQTDRLGGEGYVNENMIIVLEKLCCYTFGRKRGFGPHFGTKNAEFQMREVELISDLLQRQEPLKWGGNEYACRWDKLCT